MDEHLFGRLASLLETQSVVLASVVSTQGATPRKRSSRMLISANMIEGSVGGGMAEARVIEQARQLIDAGTAAATIDIELDGRPGSAGVCGGRMTIGLRRWAGALDRARAEEIALALASGMRVELDAGDLGKQGIGDVAVPDVRLLIFGGGHCGAALCELSASLAFERHVIDVRSECLGAAAFSGATTHASEADALDGLLATGRDVQAVLVNRDFQADVAALEMLCQHPPRFLGMLGSRRRITEVLASLPQHRDALRDLIAPVGIDIGAETPHEIAVSILAQLIEQRRHY